MFFDRYHDRGIEWYRQYFSHAQPDQFCGEVAPTYFDASGVPERIKSISPDCKIVVTLRNPIERAWSLFLHHLKKGRVSNDFWSAVEKIPRILEGGRYARHISYWQSIFGAMQISFFFLEDIKTNPGKTLLAVQKVLNVEKVDLAKGKESSLNGRSMSRFPTLARGVSFVTTMLHRYGYHKVVRAAKKTGLKSLVYSGGEKRMPEMSTSVHMDLVEKYEEDIDFVEEETGRDLSRWRSDCRAPGGSD